MKREVCQGPTLLSPCWVPCPRRVRPVCWGRPSRAGRGHWFSLLRWLRHAWWRISRRESARAARPAEQLHPVLEAGAAHLEPVTTSGSHLAHEAATKHMALGTTCRLFSARSLVFSPRPPPSLMGCLAEAELGLRGPRCAPRGLLSAWERAHWPLGCLSGKRHRLSSEPGAALGVSGSAASCGTGAGPWPSISRHRPGHMQRAGRGRRGAEPCEGSRGSHPFRKG